MQLLENSSHNEGAVMQVEGVKQTKISDQQLMVNNGTGILEQVSLELFSQSTVSANLAKLNCLLSHRKIICFITVLSFLSW